jgi:Ca2+/H+ antiporter
MSDPLTRLLAELPLAEPDPMRAERTRMGCRALLARQASRAAASRRPSSGRRSVQVWQLLIAVLGVAYLTEVIVQALSVYGPP